ncbi:LytR/AlgR family response regulator transcription factor [Anaerotignum propionicum]|uniref:LytR/AlgR family response regulator transcription factor n=1 Tax=Anaerotignum propionicum TaxID=28446 RepID=UPI002109789D|nr:LytTR family DNA-binding domain-containing protein [Anaerotignum propionicum]MCQ4936345.1 LytTR family DNA-binding domain-containing protein [Anaerotignum propionicum]
MLKIAYCDDMKIDRDKVMRALSSIEEKWKEDFEIVPFSNGEKLCNDIAQNQYDVILLDILMDGIDGIETATRIRSMGKDNLIIFISSYDDRVKELFDFRTIAFIDKPLETEKLEKALRKAYNILEKDSETIFSYKKGRTLKYIPIKEIIYFESSRNEITVYTDSYKDTFYDTLSAIWLKLERVDQFIMPHRSYIFNLMYISLKSEDKLVVRKTNKTYNIGKSYKVNTQERYLKYIEKRCRE